jgi:hypothetical protein
MSEWGEMDTEFEETAEQRQSRQRRERIAAARAALTAAYAADPEGTAQFNLRMSRLAKVAKRERQRFDHLVLGAPRPDPDLSGVTKPAGLSRQQWKIERKRLRDAGAELEPGVEEAMRRREEFARGQGTPETNANLETYHSDSLMQLERNGTINREQKEYAEAIANVYRSIESDVALKIASFEARVDNGGRAGAALIAERITRVRLHLAYTIWREQLPVPKQAVLDMIVGDAVGYTVVARRYGMHARKSKRWLIEAIDRWPSCVDRAYDVVDREVYGAVTMAEPVGLSDDWRTPLHQAEAAVSSDQVEEQQIAANEPAVELRSIDPRFLDDRGFMLPWTEIADIVRERIAEENAEDEAA